MIFLSFPLILNSTGILAASSTTSGWSSGALEITFAKSLVLFALVMGIDESGRAKIPLVCALATAIASVVYLLLVKKLSVGAINIIGGILTCAMIFMPHGNTFGFLALF